VQNYFQEQAGCFGVKKFGRKSPESMRYKVSPFMLINVAGFKNIIT